MEMALWYSIQWDATKYTREREGDAFAPANVWCNDDMSVEARI